MPDQAADTGPELFVTSGPWNALRTPLRDCEEAFMAAQLEPGAPLPRPEACCGVKLGMFATFVQTDSAESVCACAKLASMHARHATAP